MTARHLTLALAALLLAAAPLAVRADDFSDFRIPANRVLLWTGTVNGSANWRNNTNRDTHFEDGGEFGTLASSLYDRRETESRQRDLSVNVLAGGDRTHSASRTADSFLRGYADEAIYREINGSASVRDIEQWYPGKLPVSVIGDFSASLVDGRRWTSSRELVTDTSGYYYDASDASNQWDYGNTLSGSLGLGLGRVRNATGLYEALVLERRLLASGVLSRPLGREAKHQLAALFYARSNYSRTMDRPAATVWSAIEEVLRRDGALAEAGLDARRLFEAVSPFMGSRAYFPPDALPASPVARLQGRSVQLFVSARTAQRIQRLERIRTATNIPGGTPIILLRSFDRISQPADAIAGGIAAEFHRPAGLRWQLDASVRTEVSATSKKHGFSEQAAGSATFIVTDRWLASASLNHERIVEPATSGLRASDGWTVRNNASLAYWVNDHIDLKLSLTQAWSYVRGAPTLFSLGGGSSQYGQVYFGLGYRFAGFTEIPGISTPPR